MDLYNVQSSLWLSASGIIQHNSRNARKCLCGFHEFHIYILTELQAVFYLFHQLFNHVSPVLPPPLPPPQWSDRNTHRLQSLMTKEDQETFNFDVTQVKWQQYWEQFVDGVRIFLLKEDDSKQKLARQKYRR